MTNHARGEGHVNAKLTDFDVISIRSEHAKGIGYDRLARRFGVSKCAIQRIVLRRSWAHVQDPQQPAA